MPGGVVAGDVEPAARLPGGAPPSLSAIKWGPPATRLDNVDGVSTTGLVDAFTTPQLLKLVVDGRLDATRSRPTVSRSARRCQPTTPSPQRPTRTPLKVVLEAEPMAHAPVADAEALALLA